MSHHPSPGQHPPTGTENRPADLVSADAARILDQVEQAVVGKRDRLTLILSAILAGGHVLVEDLPGLGKTLAARSFAQALGLDFTRAQFTPDLLPADLTGAYIYDQKTSSFEFRQGPLFTGLLLADEINRTPPKTQAALLEAMGEKQVTVEGHTYRLPHPFHVIATANPVEQEGTYPLPEAQLDRFLIRISFGYPDQEDEHNILLRRIWRRREEQSLAPVVDADGLIRLQEATETIPVDPDITRYCVALAAATRTDRNVIVGASPRGSLALMLLARAHAAIVGRDYVTPEDVKTVAHPVLDHRIVIKPELWMSDVTGSTVVTTALNTVPVPTARGTQPPHHPGGGAPAHQHGTFQDPHRS